VLSVTEWGAFYSGELQSLWLLLVVPSLFWLYLLLRTRPGGTREARFLRSWALLFAFESALDPVATGPLARALGLYGLPLTAWIFVFVWLGDFRVLWLLFAEAGSAPDWRAAARRAALLCCLVPATTGLLYAPVWLGLVQAPGQVMWLCYELLFSALALWLRRGAHDPALRAVLTYVVAYYALWASADVLILAGVDFGWGLRVLPNQLYYSFFVPFAYLRVARA
jgi:hypothetical protein